MPVSDAVFGLIVLLDLLVGVAVLAAQPPHRKDFDATRYV